ncbi:UNVERIFIED_CONTAM: hypothetical protein RMT77_009451 [Armadillidium vulgare]
MAKEYSSRFLYFAYGSNLLSKRIHINNPSAEKLCVAVLEGYELDFGNFSSRWNGAVATITEKINNQVFGVLWTLKLEDLLNLDRQEGVKNRIYHPLEVSVKTLEGNIHKARTYQLTTGNKSVQRPSLVYLNVIIQGAVEHNLPKKYIEDLRQIENNGYDGDVDVNIPLSSSRH